MTRRSWSREIERDLDALDKDDVGLRRFLSERDDRLILWRVVPALRRRLAFELENHEPLGLPGALENLAFRRSNNWLRSVLDDRRARRLDVIGDSHAVEHVLVH